MTKKLIFLFLMPLFSFASTSFEVSSEQVGSCFSTKLSKSKAFQIKLGRDSFDGSASIELKIREKNPSKRNKLAKFYSAIAMQASLSEGQFGIECDGGSFLLEQVSEDTIFFASDYSPIKAGCFGSLKLRGAGQTLLELKKASCF